MATPIDDFLNQIVEGYLFEDLDNMATIKLTPGKNAGAAGYPMVASVNSGIELLGTLLSPTPYNPKNGNEYFCNYWQQILAPFSNKYSLKGLDKLVYNLVRHGIAHTFATKVGVLVTKGAEHLHLNIDTTIPQIHIDAVRYYQDLKKSYFKYFIPLLATQRSAMQARLAELITVYEKDSNNFFNKLPANKHLLLWSQQSMSNLTAQIQASGASTPWGRVSPTSTTSFPTASGINTITQLPSGQP